MRRAPIAVALLLVTAGAARAQGLEDRLRAQLTTTVSQLRELQAGQAALVSQKDAAEKERDALKARLAATEARLRAARATPRGASEAELAQARADQAAQDKAGQDAATAEAQRLSQELAQLRGEHEQTVHEAAEQDQALKLCRAKHAELYAAAEDALAAYDHVSAAGLLARREPVTGLGRLPAQKRVQALADRLYAARLDVRPKAPAAAQPPAR